VQAAADSSHACRFALATLCDLLSLETNATLVNLFNLSLSHLNPAFFVILANSRTRATKHFFFVFFVLIDGL
jgi:hypothetical protein